MARVRAILRSRTARRPRGEQPRIAELLDGYRATCLIVAAVQIGLFERLATGPRRAHDLAVEVGADPPSLRRFIRGLRVLGLVEGGDDELRLTPVGRLMVDEGSIARDQAVLIGEEYLPAWASLRHSVLTGEPSFDSVFGKSAWAHRRERPDLDQAFNRFMQGARRRAQEAIEAAFDFSSCRVVVDVGGGHGGVIVGLLAAHPSLRGVVFDQPHVVDGATAALEAASVLDRCTLVGGSFFDSVPPDGDVYLLLRVLHDWDDERCRVILHACRSAMSAESTLLIVEGVVRDGAVESPGLVMRDLHMMAVPGGRERTEPEFDDLLRSAGLELVRCSSQRGSDVIEARPVRRTEAT